MRGEHLTSKLSLAAAWLLVTGVCPIYRVDEFSPCLCSMALMIELMVVLFTVYLAGGMVLLLWGVDAILGDGYSI